VQNGSLIIPDVATLDRMAQKGLEIVLDRASEYGVRVICGTTEAIGEWANEGRFSKKVYAAICDNAVRIPPLRERPGDIPALIAAWLPEIVKEHGLG